MALPTVALAQRPEGIPTALSLGIRERLTERGWLQVPSMGVHVDQTRADWRLELNAWTGISAAPDRWRSTDGELRVSSFPLTVGPVSARMRLGLSRRAHGPLIMQTERDAGLEVRYTGEVSGSWLFATRTAGRVPGMTDLDAGWWFGRGSLRLAVIAKASQFREEEPTGSDSAHQDITQCRVEYDPSRKFQQYRTICPTRSRSQSLGLRASWFRSATQFDFSLTNDRHRTSVDAGSGFNGQLDVTHLLTDRVAFNLRAGRVSADFARRLPAHATLAAGFRLMPRPVARRPHRRPPVVVASNRSLTLLLGDASSVEVKGNFTGWRPVPLTRIGGGRWRYTGALGTGMHTMMIRIDGGVWQAMPGMPTAQDGFGGIVSVVIVR